MGRPFFRLLPLLLALACDGSDAPVAPPTSALFQLRACRDSEHAPAGETFHVLIRDPAVVARADQLAASGEIAILTGVPARGSDNYNQPWSWHLTPASVEFVEGSIEVCDGCPSFVEADLGNWIDVLGRFCPFVEVLARAPGPG